MTPYLSPSAALRLLGLKAGADTPAIRKAYAAKLKALDVDADPDAYARLRAARDIALRSAKAAAAQAEARGDAPTAAIEDEAQQPDPEPRETPGSWAYAAPLLPHDPPAQGSAILAGSLPPADAAPEPQAELAAPDAPPGAREATGGPPVLASAAPTDVTLLQRPDRELARLLHREGDPAPAMDDAEEARALRCLRMMLADAAQADLSLHGQIEDWLADLLAGTWPRSAPLLEETAAAFGWESERGQLRERPSIAWLNTRLRGLRFQQKVELPDHPLHKAWVELQRAGWSTRLDRWRTKSSQVHDLLAGVRKHFPELEGHFDPERVASWEGSGTVNLRRGEAATGGTAPKSPWGAMVYVVIAFAVLRVVANLADDLDPKRKSPDSLFGPPAQSAPADPDYDRILAAAVEDAFGKGKTIAWLREKQASLASILEARLRAARSEGANEAGSIAVFTTLVRRLVYIDGQRAAGSTQLQAMRLHLSHIDAASKGGPDLCSKFLSTGEIDSGRLPPAIRERERALAAAMVEAGTLTNPVHEEPRKAAVPGKLIGQIIEATGLPEDRVRITLQDDGTSAEKCAVRRALLQIALDWKDPRQTELLRVL
jgi:hypothetical protein